MPTTSEGKSKSDGVDVPCSTNQYQKSPRNINSESEPPKEQAVIQPNNQDAAVNGSSRGASWIQESSWTQLVGETNSSFSISQLLPSKNLKKQERVKPKSTDIRNLTVGKNFELVKSGRSESSKDDSKVLGLGMRVWIYLPPRVVRIWFREKIRKLQEKAMRSMLRRKCMQHKCKLSNPSKITRPVVRIFLL